MPHRDTSLAIKHAIYRSKMMGTIQCSKCSCLIYLDSRYARSIAMIFSTLLLLSYPPPPPLHSSRSPPLSFLSSYLPLLLPTPTRGVSRNLFSFYGGLGTHRGQKTISGGRAPISLHLQYDSVPNPFVIRIQAYGRKGGGGLMI